MGSGGPVRNKPLTRLKLGATKPEEIPTQTFSPRDFLGILFMCFLPDNGRLANGYFVNGYFEFQFGREMHIFSRIGRLPVFARGVQPFPSLSLPW